MAYKKFNEEEIRKAAEIDIVDLLRRQGEELKAAGSEYEWRHGADRITIRGCQWYNHYEGKGGNAINFVQTFYNKNFKEAMEFLLGESAGEIKRAKPEQKPKKDSILAPPERHDSMRRVYAYLLTKRDLDKDVVGVFARKGLIYESADYHNVVFVGKDKEDKIRHVSIRGTGNTSTYRGNVPSSDPAYSFHWHGESDKLYVFEAPIDMLSYITLNKDGWKNHSYAACCGVGDRVIEQMLLDNPNIKKVYLCLDNDEVGRKYDIKIADKLFEKGIPSKILIPINKDWNEDLTAQKPIEELQGNIEEVEECPALQL